MYVNQFYGKELDETGLYYYGARYYDPRTSQWVSPDPILKSYMRGEDNKGVFLPVNLGLYTYVANNPVRNQDCTISLGCDLPPDSRFPCHHSSHPAGVTGWTSRTSRVVSSTTWYGP